MDPRRAESVGARAKESSGSLAGKEEGRRKKASSSLAPPTPRRAERTALIEFPGRENWESLSAQRLEQEKANRNGAGEPPRRGRRKWNVSSSALSLSPLPIDVHDRVHHSDSSASCLLSSTPSSDPSLRA